MPVPLFETITQPLTEYELNVLLPAIVSSFRKRVGKHNAITSDQICERMTTAGYKITGVTLRKIVHHIRENALIVCLVGSSGGYYVSNDPEEIQKQIESLRSRENSIRTVREKMEESLLKLSA